MDAGLGRLEPVSDTLASLLAKSKVKDGKGRSNSLKNRLFTVGEVVQVKDSMFQIQAITRHKLYLKLLPDNFKL